MDMMGEHACRVLLAPMRDNNDLGVRQRDAELRCRVGEAVPARLFTGEDALVAQQPVASFAIERVLLAWRRREWVRTPTNDSLYPEVRKEIRQLGGMIRMHGGHNKSSAPDKV